MPPREEEIDSTGVDCRANRYSTYIPLFYLLETLFPQYHVRRLPTGPVANRNDPRQNNQSPAERSLVTEKVKEGLRALTDRLDSDWQQRSGIDQTAAKCLRHTH